MLVASGTIPELVKTFAELVAKGEIEVYNEFSLQHELGILLRQRFPENRVQFERNVSHFSMPKKNFTKKEIDISVFSPDMTDLLCAIELKYPRNGQYPEQMYSFCKDLAFTEELKASGFRQAFVIIFAEDYLFYEGAGDGIYGYFRAGKELHGPVTKPTGKKDSQIFIKGRYVVQWVPIYSGLKYTLIEVTSGRQDCK